MSRTILINVLVLCALLVLVEVGVRIAYFTRSCRTTACDYHAFQLVNFLDRRGGETSVGHPQLGHVPRPGDYVATQKGWSGQTVTIEADGTRSNGHPAPAGGRLRLLAVGDSFTFGAQVADADTWPAALERILNAPVVNGGVNGYGFAQSALRGEVLIESGEYRLVILSVYAPHDFSRDRLLTRYSSHKPAWVKKNGDITVSYPGDHEELRRALIDKEIQLPEFTGYSYVLKKINKDVFGYLGGHFIEHPDAAPIEEIICHVTDKLRSSNIQAAILVQYGRDTLEGERPAIIETLEKCASDSGVPLIDSFDYLANQPDRDRLFFGHMTPAGNEKLAEFVAAELRRKIPDLF